MDAIPDPYVERLEDEVDRLRLLNTELLSALARYLEYGNNFAWNPRLEPCSPYTQAKSVFDKAKEYNK
jgi:hypothetical protein